MTKSKDLTDLNKHQEVFCFLQFAKVYQPKIESFHEFWFFWNFLSRKFLQLKYFEILFS